MNNKELEILKDKYAMETLNEQEYASLEVEKLQNPKLESELKIHTDLVRGVEYAGQLELQDMLDKIHYQQVGNVPKSVKSRKTLYLSNDIKLTAAISANEIGDLVLADRLLNEIIEMKDYYFMDHAIWYKALIKLKTGDIASVKDILTPIISNPKADHHMEAKELVSKLKINRLYYLNGLKY